MFKLTIENSSLFAIVDAEDLERLSKFKWYLAIRKPDNAGHIFRTICLYNKPTINISLANEILKRYNVIFDHIDRDFTNCQKSNLRESTISQNNHNKEKYIYIDATSKYKGVTKRRSTWQARISKDGRTFHIGSFTTEESAARAYDIKAIELYGEFASLNFG